jgi:hypothetical protein
MWQRAVGRHWPGLTRCLVALKLQLSETVCTPCYVIAVLSNTWRVDVVCCLDCSMADRGQDCAHHCMQVLKCVDTL